jgi:hypothetical protein
MRRGTRTRVRAHWIAVGCAAALAGCADDPLTTRELTAQADAICADHSEALRDLLIEVDESWNDDDYAQLYGRWADEIEDLHDDLAELDSPADARGFERYLDRLERNVDGYREAAGGDFDLETLGRTITNSENEAIGLASAAGLRRCSSLGEF